MFLPVIWQYVGFYFVILITGLNNIPEDLFEAAALDGADGLKKVRCPCCAMCCAPAWCCPSPAR